MFRALFVYINFRILYLSFSFLSVFPSYISVIPKENEATRLIKVYGYGLDGFISCI